VAACPAAASGPGIIRQRALPTADDGITPLLFAIRMVTTTSFAFHPWMNLSHAPQSNRQQYHSEGDQENARPAQSRKDGNCKAQVRNPGQV